MVIDGSDDHGGGGASIPSGSQQVSKDPTHNQYQNNRPRFDRGLMPTDGQDAYKRSQDRASRRSRLERTSYLVATGHLDSEETEQLTKQSMADFANDTTQCLPGSPVKSNNLAHTNSISDYTNQRLLKTIRNSSKKSNFEPSFLNDPNRTLVNGTPPIAKTNSQLLQPYELKQQDNNKPKRKDSRRKYRKELSSLYNPNRIVNSHSANYDGDNNGRGKFKQTYTEVTLPMKTSPAFEYILKDDERRNKRCCLWFLYSTLLTICIAIMIFCSVHLVLRHLFKSP